METKRMIINGTVYEIGPEKAAKKAKKKTKKSTKKKAPAKRKKATKKKAPAKRKKVAKKVVTVSALGKDHKASVYARKVDERSRKVVGHITKAAKDDKRAKSRYTLRTKGGSRISGHTTLALARKAAQRHFG